MPDPKVHPWMRRAAEAVWMNAPLASDGDDIQRAVANEIAAHAPPVEEMVEALSSIACLCAEGVEFYETKKLIPAILDEAMKAHRPYNSWLAKQGEWLANG